MNAAPGNKRLRDRLFRLIVMLKGMTWVAMLAVLGVSLYRLATGAENPVPQGALYAIGLLVALQLLALLAWRLTREPAA